MSPTEIVNAFMHAIERKDVAAAVAFAAPSISYENVPTDPIVGVEGLATALGRFLGAAGEVEWRVTRQHEFGNTVVNERVDRFQIGAGWLELPVAGFFEVDDDGKITLWRDYFDMGSYIRQLGALTKG
jgi:limonene-1,2-epoxide hydrolase